MSLNDLNEKIEGYCSENKIYAALRVSLCDKIVYSKNIGYADEANKIPISDKSLFSLYSLSKPFCAIAILKLRDRGLVDIDAHPSKYLPEAKGFDERVTIRHLLQHISGLPDFYQTADFAKMHAPGYAYKSREHLKLLSAYPSHFVPATGEMYANVNFVICALIVENVSKMSYAEYMKREIFKPLGMKTAVVDNEKLVISERVKCYEMRNGEAFEVSPSYDWMLGAGDIVAGTEDVYCLNKAIKNKLLLSEETWDEVLTPSPLNSMGMGCTISLWHGKKRITHNGGHIGFRTLHIQLPDDDFDIILLSNCGFGNARDDISEMIYEHFYGKDNKVTQAVSMDKGYI